MAGSCLVEVWVFKLGRGVVSGFWLMIVGSVSIVFGISSVVQGGG